jgi:RHS repeat-associated protein
MQMAERTYASASAYRFGYQGSEQDPEVHNGNDVYNTEYRLLDARLGRWFSADPLEEETAGESPYVSMNDSPISLNDVFGLSSGNPGTMTRNPKNHMTKKTKQKPSKTKKGSGKSPKDKSPGTNKPKSPKGPTTTPTKRGKISEVGQRPSDQNTKILNMVKQNMSGTVTFSTTKKTLLEMPPEYQGWGDVYEVTAQSSQRYGEQKMININKTIEEGKPLLNDLSINAGPLRMKLDPNGPGSLTTSVQIDNYRFGFGMNNNYLATFSSEYRAKGFGVQTNFSYRPGGGSVLGLAVAAVAIPEAIGAGILSGAGEGATILYKAYKTLTTSTRIIP